MDLVLVGLPGSGKSVVGKRLAQRHGAAFIDLDEVIEREAHRASRSIFATEGEAAFRERELAAVRSRGSRGPGAATAARHRHRRRHADRPAQSLAAVPRAASPSGSTARPEVLAQRLRRSRNVRPLIAGRDPIGRPARAVVRTRAVLRGGPPAERGRRDPRRRRSGRAAWSRPGHPRRTMLLRPRRASGGSDRGRDRRAGRRRGAAAA